MIGFGNRTGKSYIVAAGTELTIALAGNKKGPQVGFAAGKLYIAFL